MNAINPHVASNFANNLLISPSEVAGHKNKGSLVAVLPQCAYHRYTAVTSHFMFGNYGEGPWDTSPQSHKQDKQR